MRIASRHRAATLVLAASVGLCTLSVASDADAFGPKVAAQSKLSGKKKPDWKLKKEAKAAYIKGKAAMKQGKYAEAAEHFEKADSLVPGAAPKYQIAVAYDKAGDVEKAVKAYRKFISSNPSQKYADRVVAAGKRVAELEKQLIGKVTLNVTPPDLPGLTVTVDGNPAEGTQLELEPGDHTVIVSAEGYEPTTQTVTVRAGEPLDVPITLNAVQATPPPPPPDDVEEDGEGPNGLLIAGYTTFGITVAAGVVTGVFGGMALGSASDFEETPTEELADDAENQALLSDVFLGITGAAAIATGVLLYLGYTADDDGGDGADTALLPEVQPYAGPQGGGTTLTWSF